MRKLSDDSVSARTSQLLVTVRQTHRRNGTGRDGQTDRQTNTHKEIPPLLTKVPSLALWSIKRASVNLFTVLRTDFDRTGRFRSHGMGHMPKGAKPTRIAAGDKMISTWNKMPIVSATACNTVSRCCIQPLLNLPFKISPRHCSALISQKSHQNVFCNLCNHEYQYWSRKIQTKRKEKIVKQKNTINSKQ